jgi:serine/threonine protein phosphatase PrpC
MSMDEDELDFLLRDVVRYLDKDGEVIDLGDSKKLADIKSKGEYFAYYPPTQTYVYQKTSSPKANKVQDEDAWGSGAVAGFSRLFADKEGKIFKKTFAQLQHYYGLIEQGTTAVVCAVNREKIITAYLGDSPAYIVVKNEAGDIIELRCLTKELHNGENEAERMRAGMQFMRSTNAWVMPGGLAMSRSIGDDYYNDKKLSHEPSIYFDEITIPKGGSAFALLVTDGVLDKAKKNSNEQSANEENTQLSDVEIIKSFLEKKSPHAADEATLIKALPIAKRPAAIVKCAVDRGSRDDITAAVVPLSADDANDEARVVSVWDGHGGVDVSHAAAAIFVELLKENISNPTLDPKEEELFTVWDEFTKRIVARLDKERKVPPALKTLYEEACKKRRANDNSLRAFFFKSDPYQVRIDYFTTLIQRLEQLKTSPSRILSSSSSAIASTATASTNSTGTPALEDANPFEP